MACLEREACGKGRSASLTRPAPEGAPSPGAGGFLPGGQAVHGLRSLLEAVFSAKPCAAGFCRVFAMLKISLFTPVDKAVHGWNRGIGKPFVLPKDGRFGRARSIIHLQAIACWHRCGLRRSPDAQPLATQGFGEIARLTIHTTFDSAVHMCIRNPCAR